MSTNTIAQVPPEVNGQLKDEPIDVYLSIGHFQLDMTSQDQMEKIPFDGRPCYGPERTAADRYGLGAVA